MSSHILAFTFLYISLTSVDKFSYTIFMIVTMTDRGWDVIHQPAHALLASKLAHHWKQNERSPFWTELLVAIAQHDSYQQGLDTLTSKGVPKGFTVSKSEGEIDSLEQPREVIRQARYQGQYVALLLAKHIHTLYRAKHASSKTLAKFLDELEEDQKKWFKSLSISARQAESDYAIMLWCDRCSLILCQDQIPTAKRKIEVQHGPWGSRHFLWQREDRTLGVETWPFEEDEFSVDVEVHKLDQLCFDNDGELKKALQDADVECKNWLFRR